MMASVMRALSRLLPLLVVSLAATPPLAAQETGAFTIRDIRVEGIERLESGIIFRNMDVDIGDVLQPGDTARLISRLFATGVFQDVVLRREGDILVVQVVENPTVFEIGFRGMNEFDEDEMLAQLESVDVAKSAVLRTGGVDQATKLIEAAYLEKAFYAVQIQPTTTPLDENRVRIDFEVREGAPVKVGEVLLLGAAAEDADDVLDRMQIRPTNWLSWYRRDDVYSSSTFLGDIERIRDHYLSRGYLRFEVLSSEVILSRSRDSIRIVIVVEEGPQYRLGGWTFSGDYEFDPQEAGVDLGLTAGEIYSATDVQRAAGRIRRHLGDRSYARATVTPRRSYDDEGGVASVDFVVRTGKPVFVRRIDIAGNFKTRDEVIRRELRQFESSMYSAEKIERSRRRLNRLGIFDRVSFDEVPVEGADDEIDLALEVEESAAGTGSVGFGLGFSRDGGVSFSGTFETKNIFGTGNDLAAGVLFSDTAKRYSVDFDEPYVTEYGVSRHIGISRSELESSDDAVNYRVEGTDLDYGYGIPVGEETVLFVNVHYEADRLLNTAQISGEDLEAVHFLRRHGEKTASYLASASLTRDTRDSALVPKEGYRQSLSGRISIPGSDLRYYRVRMLHHHFFPLSEEEDYALGLLGEVSYAEAYRGAYPFYKRFFLGGPASLRGFDAGSVGDKDSDGNAFGGRLRLRGAAEYFFPMPLVREFGGARTSFFVDAGGIYADESDFSVGQMRASAGLEVRWLSPLGPIKFILAKPVKYDKNDRTRTFDFTLGLF